MSTPGEHVSLMRRATRGSGLGTSLLHSGLASLSIKLGYAALTTAVAVLLARLLGPEAYGVYVYVFALVSLMAILAQLGLPTLLMRETASADVQSQWGLMRGIWRWANAVTLISSAVLIAIGSVSAWLLSGQLTREQLAAFGWGMLLVPLIALAELRSGALRGLRRVIQGQLPGMLIRPGLFLTLILIVIWSGLASSLTAANVMALHAVATSIAFMIGAAFLWCARPARLAVAKPSYRQRSWLQSTVPLAMLGTLQATNGQADLVMLGLFADAEDVGVYRVAVQAAMLAAFALDAINMVTAPYFARLYTLGDRAQMQKVATLSARGILAFSIPIAMVLVAGGDMLLSAIFGKGFEAGYPALIILLGGQLLNAAFGPAGTLLNMTGHERYTMRAFFMSVGVNIILNLALIPIFGVAGAAAAAAASIVVWKMVLWRMALLKVGINTSAL